MYKTEINNPSQDERIMAGLAHISAILPMMGLVAPIVIWVTQKDKSKFVAFQALQAVAYQLAMILVYFACMVFYALSMFGTFFFTIPGANQSAVPTFMFLPFCVFGFIFIGGFFVIVYALYGAFRAFQGNPFRYLIIANLVDKFINSNNNGN